MDDDEGSLGFDDPEFSLTTDSSKPSLRASWDEDVLDDDNKKSGPNCKKTYSTSPEDMMSAFGFQQGSCDFCLKFVDDQSVGLLQKCMCGKKYFCIDCMKRNSLVAEHQQECATERFQKRQAKLNNKH